MVKETDSESTKVPSKSNMSVVIFIPNKDTTIHGKLAFHLYNRSMELSKRLEMDQLRNCRDLGGILTKDGRKVRSKAILRSDFLHEASLEDLNRLKAMGLKEVFDFRGFNEVALTPDPQMEGASHHHLPMMSKEEILTNPPYPHEKIDLKNQGFNAVQEFLYRFSPTGDPDECMSNNYVRMIDNPYCLSQWAIFFRILLKTDGMVLYHCRDGKDRTGIATLLILYLLGVDFETIREDYILSAEYMTWKVEWAKEHLISIGLEDHPIFNQIWPLETVHMCWMDAAIARLKDFGTADHYFEKQIGLSKEEIRRFRSKFLE